MPKISSYMIAMLCLGFIIAVIGLWMADAQENYSLSSYDNTSIARYNKLEEISVIAKDVENGTNIQEKAGILDIVGGYLSDAYSGLQITKRSFDVFDEMSNSAIEQANLGASGRYLKTLVAAVLVIIIAISVLLSALIKRDL